MLDVLTAAFQPWADYYAASSWLPTAVIAVHVVALFIGGGIAVGADRRVVLAAPGSSEAYLAIAADLHATHRVVITALALTVMSGVALCTADLGTFWSSRVFWLKMGAIGLLVLNGALMQQVERQVLTNARNTIEMSTAGPEVTEPWLRLRRHASLSLAGWIVVVLLGVLVANI